MIDLALVLLPVAAVFLLAGLVKGVIGLGLPAVAMGLLGLLMPPVEAAAILLLPSLLTNIWQALDGPAAQSLLRRLWPMLLAAFIGSIAATGLMAKGDATLATLGLGAALVLYALLGLSGLRLRVPGRAERWTGLAVGGATGVVTGATGVFVIPAAPYLAGLGLDRDTLVQALGLSFTVSTLALGVGLFWHDALPLAALGGSLAAIAPALAGMAMGGWLRRRVRPSIFRSCFFAGLGILGAQILWRSWA